MDNTYKQQPERHTSHYHAFAWAYTLFRYSSVIFEATRHILSQKHPVGVRWRPSADGNFLRRMAIPRDETDNRQPIFHNMYGNTMRDETSPYLAPSPVSAETLHDVSVLLSSRIANGLGLNVALADVTLGEVVCDYIVDERRTEHDSPFDIARYRALDIPLMPEVALFVLEALHPTHRPTPRLVYYPSYRNPKTPDVYLYLWRHAYLRIPLTVDYNSSGILASSDNQYTMPAWKEVFGYMCMQHGSHSASAWEQRYPGLQTPRQGIANWLPEEARHAVEKLYDGWFWVLAGLHWLCVSLACDCTPSDYSHFHQWMRHYVAAMYLAENRPIDDDDSDGSSPSTRRRVPFSRLNVANVIIRPAATWIRRIASLAHVPFNVTSLEAFLEQWQSLGIIHCLDPDDVTHADPMLIDEPERDSASLDHWGSNDALVGTLGWRLVLGRLDAGIAKYIKDHAYL